MEGIEVRSLAGEPTNVALQRLEAWLSLPHGDHAELLRGSIVYKATPSFEHGDAVIGISGQLDRFRGPPAAGGGGWWLSQEVDLYLGGQGLRPDLVGWRTEKHPAPPRKVNVGERHFGVYVTPPDWVCEVLSPSTRSRDEDNGLKWQTYWQAGVGHYWLLDLVRSQLTVYGRGERDYEPIDVAGRTSVKALAPFEGAEVDARRVFLLAEVTRR
jgi:Uma2 family endonuclease